jgi:hypothetical protein
MRRPEVSRGRCKRQISRSLRRTRLRATASPKRRGVIRPKRASPAAGSRAMLKRNKRPCAECPCERTSANSRLNLMRTALGKPNLSGFGVTGVGDLDTLGQQAFATALPTAAQNRAATFRLHSSAKTELALARALAWLVGAFHKTEKWSRLEYAFQPDSQSWIPDRPTPQSGAGKHRSQQTYLHSDA